MSNNTTPKRYRLKKDVLNYSTGQIISSGEVFSNIEGTRKYISQSGWYMSEAACLRKDWFEEVEEIKEPERIYVGGMCFDDYSIGAKGRGYDVLIIHIYPENVRHKITNSHFPAIKESLEKVLNEEYINSIK